MGIDEITHVADLDSCFIPYLTTCLSSDSRSTKTIPSAIGGLSYTSTHMFRFGFTQHKNNILGYRGSVSYASTLRFKGIKRGRPLSTIAHPTRVKEGKSPFNSCVQSAHCVISCLCRTNGPCLLRVRMTKASPPSPWTLWLNEITHMS